MENDRDILLIAMFTFLTVFVWIFAELFKTSQTSTIQPATKQIITPLQTKIDTEVFQILNQRKNYK
jgi:hypothetical protein